MLVVWVLILVALVSFMRALWECVRGFRKVNSGFRQVAEISPRSVLVHNRHTASEPLVEISLDY
jgi:hypothetical protein